jgi:hypothetical protein
MRCRLTSQCWASCQAAVKGRAGQQRRRHLTISADLTELKPCMSCDAALRRLVAHMWLQLTCHMQALLLYATICAGCCSHDRTRGLEVPGAAVNQQAAGGRLQSHSGNTCGLQVAKHDRTNSHLLFLLSLQFSLSLFIHCVTLSSLPAAVCVHMLRCS